MKNQTVEIDLVLSSFCEIISGPGAERQDWDKMRYLFYPGARLFPNSVTVNPLDSCGVDIDTYIQNLDRFLGQNDFFERGATSQVFIEGNIASVISTYEARRPLSDQQPFVRGVNFIHLLRTGSEWKFTNMIWRNLHEIARNKVRLK